MSFWVLWLFKNVFSTSGLINQVIQNPFINQKKERARGGSQRFPSHNEVNDPSPPCFFNVIFPVIVVFFAVVSTIEVVFSYSLCRTFPKVVVIGRFAVHRGSLFLIQCRFVLVSFLEFMLFFLLMFYLQVIFIALVSSIKTIKTSLILKSILICINGNSI